jgi:hypothetical protein
MDVGHTGAFTMDTRTATVCYTLHVAASRLDRIRQREVACCACGTDLVDKERLVRNMIELEEDVACVRSAHNSHGNTQDWWRL